MRTDNNALAETPQQTWKEGEFSSKQDIDQVDPTAPQPRVYEAPQSPAGPESWLIWARDLTKVFGEQRAVDGISIALGPGTIFGFIGPSGSGKTTTIRLLTGIYQPSEGEVIIFNHKPTHFRRRERERIGYMPQNFVLYQDLTVWENMIFAASIYGGRPGIRQQIRRLLDFVDLDEHRSKLARDISGGMQRRLSLASTLIHDPELLFLDEPTASIDPLLRAKFWDYFRSLKEAGRTLFITTQYVSEASYCDLVGVMHAGRLIVVDTPQKLRYLAMGGEIVDLRTIERLEYRHVQQLQELPFIISRIVRVADNEVRLVVDKASAAISKLVEWTNSQELSVDSIHEFFPPFDDVFVKLIERQDHAA